MSRHSTATANRTPLARLLASGVLLLSTAFAQAVPAAGAATAPVPAPAASQAKSSGPSSNWHARESARFKRNWGVDIVGVRLLASGSMLEFSYRVLDVNKAKPLNDKHKEPYLLDQASGLKLEVPQVEKIGKLRTAPAPQAGRIYWVMFANPGKLVKPGGQVNVVIGDFHVDGLVVE